MWHKAEWMGRPIRLELTRIKEVDNAVSFITESFIYLKGMFHQKIEFFFKCIVYFRFYPTLLTSIWALSWLKKFFYKDLYIYKDVTNGYRREKNGLANVIQILSDAAFALCVTSFGKCTYLSLIGPISFYSNSRVDWSFNR